MVAFAVTAKMFPSNIALTTAIVETSLNCAIATSPYIGAKLYEVRFIEHVYVLKVKTSFINCFGQRSKDEHNRKQAGCIFSRLQFRGGGGGGGLQPKKKTKKTEKTSPKFEI